MNVPLLLDGPADAPLTVALAHGAGAGMDTAFMETVAQGLAAGGFQVARFEFPYMMRRRADGRKRPPDRPPVLRQTIAEIASGIGAGRLVLGGKSMGGRIASEMADELGVRGLICLGYPFHAPGKPQNPRIDHLRALRTPALILQGERDPFGTKEDIAAYPLAPGIRLHFLKDGEHSFKPRKASGITEAENLAEAVAAATAFLKALT